MKPFLILQARPETAAADAEFRAILTKGGIAPAKATRIRLDREPLPEDIDLGDFSGTILGGGPGCVSDPPEEKSPDDLRIEAALANLMPQITGRDLPFLGCCLGIGILGHHLGGAISKERYGEPVGTSACEVTPEGIKDPLLEGVAPAFDAFVGHKEAMQELPPGCALLVTSQACPYQMVRFGRKVYATQFHPEADAAEFELRISLYRDFGYFPASDADRLIDLCRAATVVEPERILRNFVSVYGA